MCSCIGQCICLVARVSAVSGDAHAVVQGGVPVSLLADASFWALAFRALVFPATSHSPEVPPTPPSIQVEGMPSL